MVCIKADISKIIGNLREVIEVNHWQPHSRTRLPATSGIESASRKPKQSPSSTSTELVLGEASTIIYGRAEAPPRMPARRNGCGTTSARDQTSRHLHQLCDK